MSTSQQYQKGFRQLIAWQKAHTLTLSIYKSTRNFPADERFGMTNQLRRAASSTAAQIAEGSYLSTKKHRFQFYQRAYASNAEIDYFLQLALDLSYIDSKIYKELLKQVNTVGLFLHRLAAANK